MAFVQIVSYSTASPDALAEAHRVWREATDGVSAPYRRLLLRDREDPERFVEVVFYGSYEDAAHNAFLPATAAILGHAAADAERGVTVRHLDVVTDER